MRPSLFGDKSFQGAVVLEPPIEGLPVRVRALRQDQCEGLRPKYYWGFALTISVGITH